MNTEHDVPLAVIGCDYRIASTSFRERLVMDREERAKLLRAIRGTDPEAGLVALETCNRIEWIVSTASPEWLAALLEAQMTHRLRRSSRDGNAPKPYVFTGMPAVRHVLRVVAGLESLAVGEAQIAGQFQKALDQARKEDAGSIVLNGLGVAAGRMARTAQRLGFRSNGHHGIHGMTVDFIRSRFPSPGKDRVVAVAGMGAIGRKTASLASEALGCRVVRLNRTVSRVHEGQWLPLRELLDAPPGKQRETAEGWDALVLATGSHTPIFHLENLAAPHRNPPLLVIDIGIPRQAVAGEAPVPGIAYHDVDDLVECRAGEGSAHQAQAIREAVEKETARFRRFCLARDLSRLLETIQVHRKDYIEEKIPMLIQSHRKDMDAATANLAEQLMKQLIRQYANDVFNAIHTALEDYRGAER